MQTDIPFTDLYSLCEELLTEQKEFKAKVTKADATDNSNSIACIILCNHVLDIADRFGLNDSPILEWFESYDKRHNLCDVESHLDALKILLQEINCAVEYQFIQHRVLSLYFEDTKENYNSKFSPETGFLPRVDKGMATYYITAVNDLLRIKTLNEDKMLIFNQNIKDELMNKEDCIQEDCIQEDCIQEEEEKVAYDDVNERIILCF